VVAVSVILVRRGSRTLAVAAGIGALAAVLWQAMPDPALPAPSGLRVTFLDVGQGDAILVQAPRGSVLVDQGPPEAHVARQLRRLDVRDLSLLVLTHPQRDHVGGAADVLEAVSVRRVLDPRLAATGPEQREALAEARKRHIPVVTARPGLHYAMGKLRLKVLWPDGPGVRSEDPNARATVCLVSYGEIDVLLGADAESDVLLPLRLPPVEILKVSHHGSEDALLPGLLDEVKPRVAVISVGAANTYGHPTPETLAALDAVPGLAVYRTDRDGAVTVESDGHEVSVTTEE
jgi:competence protein ComEC